MRSLFLITTVCSVMGVTIASRPKNKDSRGNDLILLAHAEVSCDQAKYGYGTEDGKLVNCTAWREIADGKSTPGYEEDMCKKLRVNAEMVDGKCQCKEKFSGPTCNQFDMCDKGQTRYLGVCTSNMCQHDGEMAIGWNKLECKCPLPWDGDYCNRLACFRMADGGKTEHRWRNAGMECKCADGYYGDGCSLVNKCEDGDLIDGICNCHTNYTGDFCDRLCKEGETCAGMRLYQTSITVLLGLVLPVILFSRK